MGLYKDQNIITGSYMLPRADDIRQVNVSRKRMHIKKREEQEKKEDEGREENKEAGSTKNICQRSTSLPHLRLGGL
jgi:post-segregation antitoxin (ccd killing protein)